MNADPNREVAIFSEILDIPPEKRQEYLERACAGDEHLRRRVEALLQVHDRAGKFLEESPNKIAAEGLRTVPNAEKAGDLIGRYLLIQQIGEGGCGIVFMAEQEEPVRRSVALKVVKPGMDTNSVIARFEAERQALALMDHPNIAQVFDAGSTQTGRPFFVMELVRGTKITEYCDQNSLSTTARLELFAQVCDAIQHAHQKGIIHRDIKPSNIMVATGSDGKPIPKVIDFGIAKAVTGQQLTDKTIFTAHEMLIGTPAYMSPEQAALTSVEVDTRTDIYSLGVLLYELLTGATLFDARELLKAGFDEVRRVIREEEPVRPSTRLSMMRGSDITNVCQYRDAEPSTLIRQLRGDLDWIAMKAVEKDRARRYETANGLGRDVRRFLAQEPVSARPPSKLYQLQKAVLRNKLLFSSIGIIALLLVVSLIIVSASLAKERRARRDAEAASVKSQQVTEFLENMLSGVGPSVALGEKTQILKEMLDRTAKGVDDEITNQPAVEAELRNRIGNVYREIGNHKEAEQMHRSALDIRRQLFGPEDPMVAESLNDLALDLQAENKPVEAAKTFTDALAIRQQLFGMTNADTATSLNDLGAVYRDEKRLNEAEALTRQVLQIRIDLFGETNLVVADSLRNLSIIQGDQGKWVEAEATAQEVLAIRRRLLDKYHPWIAASLTDVAWAAGAQKTKPKLDEADAMEREALAIRQKVLGEDHPDTAKSLYSVGNREEQLGNDEQARVFLTAALSIQRKLLDEDDPDLLYTLKSLGVALEDENKWSEAEPIFREVLAGWRKRGGDEHAETLYAMERLGLSLEAENKWSEAESIYHEALTGLRKQKGVADLETLDVMNKLGLAFEGEGKNPEEEATYREALAIWLKRAGDEDSQSIYTMKKLGETLSREGKFPEAETFCREELAARQKKEGDEDPETLYSLRRLSDVLQSEGKWPEVEAAHREELAGWRKKGKAEEQQTMYMLRTLGLTLETEKKWPEAEAVHREALSVSVKKGGNEDSEALVDRERLVRVLINENKFDEAERLLNEALTPTFVRQPSAYNLLIQRVDLIGRQQRWLEAATNAALILQLQPADHYNCHRLVVLLAILQSRPEYEKLCKKVLITYSNTTDYFVAERMAQDCLFLPHSGVDLRTVDKLADVSVTRGSHDPSLPYFQGCKAMSSYRLGNFREAIAWAEKAVKSSMPEAQAKAFAVIAMANWQLGQQDEARTALAKGDTLAPRIKPEHGKEDLGESWVAWLSAGIQLDEAAALIQPATPDASASVKAQ